MIVKINVMKRYETLNNGAEGSRNCLYINVYKGFVPRSFRG